MCALLWRYTEIKPLAIAEKSRGSTSMPTSTTCTPGRQDVFGVGTAAIDICRPARCFLSPAQSLLSRTAAPCDLALICSYRAIDICRAAPCFLSLAQSLLSRTAAAM
ncbi:unnamed protein product [Dicrocoelium dendriticum]|nr:unnamed protein product [Dicrocoelium dendriticum]